MRLIFIRHGDPDYDTDSLTETGKIEAELLSRRMIKEKMDYIYVSPLGRARETADYTLKKLNRTAQMKPWLREFPSRAMRPGEPERAWVVWDWLPADWTARPELFDRRLWRENEIMLECGAGEEYDRVISGFDEVLKEHGYEYRGELWHTDSSNDDTLVFFCHFGVTCVMLSHLLGISPMVLWQNFAASTSSVTSVYTEERREGTVSFRLQYYGDVSHLTEAGREPSFAGRFCEQFSDPTRH